MSDDIRNILVTGGAGQIGIALAASVWPDGFRLVQPSRTELDLSDGASVAAFIQAGRFAAVINSAAYTAVDHAEAQVGAAFAANATGPAFLADATRAAGIPLIQISTDYVFDGRASVPYSEDDAVNPLGVYGASKLAGEWAVTKGNPRSIVLRTAWVVSPYRNNFIKTMLRLGQTHNTLRVVDDQRGCPTSAADIAEAVKTIALRLIDDPAAPVGVYHFVNAGEASWCELAREVFRISGQLGGNTPAVEAITTRDYPTVAVRPANSRLATRRIMADYGIVPRPWRDAIDDIVSELINGAKA